MSVSVSSEVIGLKETIKQLNSVDKVARRQLTRDVQPLGRLFAEAIAANFPRIAYHRGFKYKWRQYTKKRTTRSGNTYGGGYRELLPVRDESRIAKARVKINTRGARARNRAAGAKYETLTVFAVLFEHPFLNVIEFAGMGKVNRTREGWLKQADQFNELAKRDYGNNGGGGGRIVWDAIDNHPEVVQALNDGITKTLYKALEAAGMERGHGYLNRG